MVGWLVSIKGNEYRVTLGEGRDQVGFRVRKRRKSIERERVCVCAGGSECVSEGTERE